MIAEARAMNRNSRCVFVLNRRRDLRAFESDRFPVIYSRLVLQHVRRYIAEMVRVLAPDGMLMFQLPEHRGVDSCDTCRRYLKTIDLGRLGLAVPIVDEVAGVTLDAWATEHGYEKMELNLVGM